MEPERPVLYRRIEERFDQMLSAGAVEEVRALLRRELPTTLPVMKAIGVREIAAFLQDEIPLEEAAARAKTETRRYAKRQLTWFRNQMRDWQRIPA
jgi:tRNA dimethylallyltransferase